ncbi:NACHT, LRR and PYD domains-containing protein 12 [Astyanax mexicanus]|uniref:NACHT, LRR and PYD domains-containing protein 12 n=1 Tax=Astyanax mexicanus TaxID=7994 RepID=UPI0020CAFE00|nr:NACHT, LRR and PYD domains-containing protein 12 [Astyanax mexicanus]
MEVSPEDHIASTLVKLTAHTGGTICAPMISRNNIQGSVTVNINNIYRETSCNSTSTVPDAGSPVASALTEEYIVSCGLTHKSDLEKKFRNINEGISHQGTSTLLNKIYTELYVTEGGSGEVNNEHEIRQIEIKSKRQTTQETPINCNNIFKPSTGKDKYIRTVLTRGVAGIGKTVSVQKFILDWVEGKANQDILLMFPLSFRELNLIKEKTLSLLDLLHNFFPKLKQFRLIDLINCADFKLMFIFDGLDECRLPINLVKNTILSDASEPASVDVLLTNLIKGNLLPSALLWITSRPAAANQILLQYINQVTEIRGFSDPQKEEYFRKRISDESLAEQIITHIKSSRSLYIMCHIPVFCWIAATVLERKLSEAESGDIPKTLTQMFIHFLIFQIKHSSQKYEGKCDIDPHLTKERVLALGELAFQHLESGDLIFYEEDLRLCGTDVKDLLVYSGVCTQIFREEFGLHLEKVFSFVHLSVQEFLAALFAFYSFMTGKGNVLLKRASGFLNIFKKPQLFDFLRCAVDKALESKNGHLDLFLRFLLGLSLESNQNPLRGLLPQSGNISPKNDQIVNYIKKMIRENSSPEKSINLFHCLNELNDHSLVQEVQTYLRKGDDSCLNGVKLSPDQWSALVFVLLNSEEELDEFDLGKYHSSEECLLRLLPVVKASRKAVLRCCNLTEKGCAALASTFNSNSSCLRELDLSNNELQDSGVKKLCAGMKNPHCKLEALRLCNSIKEEGCVALVKALKSNPSYLRELNLNYNNLGESGVKELSDLLEDLHCKLKKLHLEDCSITEERCASLVKALKSNPSHLKELNLNHNKPGESGAEGLCKLLKDSECRLEKLQLHDCGITEESCEALVKALKSNPSHLRELNMSWNKLTKLGVIELSDLLKDPQCKLKKLQLEGCSITEKGCVALVQALKSNPSHLRGLTLNYCKPGESGVKEISDLLKDPQCKLEKLLLEGCSVAEEGCVSLLLALKSNPSHLKELSLSLNKTGDSGVKEISDLLKVPHCKLEKLQLWSCYLTEKSCAVLASALMSTCLKELDLSNNELQDSGVKKLSVGLENPECKLETLRLWGCELTGKSCAALASVLSKNNSSLKELDLKNNKLQDSGAKELSVGLKNLHCKLEKLGLSNCSIRGEGCAALVRALNSNPSHLKELNLTLNIPGELAKKLLSDLLRNPHCKLEKLNL